jgi:uncharacterized protein YkwD
VKALVALTFLLSLGIAVPAALAAGVPSNDDGVQPFAAVRHSERALDAAEMLADLNDARAKADLPALEADAQLGEVAHLQAVDMIVRHYFAHETPEGASPFDRMQRAGCRYSWAGENMAINVNAGSAFRALLASPGHRDNILNPHYHRVGIAAVPSASGEVFVQDFSD